jgi:hypothetical protein
MAERPHGGAAAQQRGLWSHVWDDRTAGHASKWAKGSKRARSTLKAGLFPAVLRDQLSTWARGSYPELYKPQLKPKAAVRRFSQHRAGTGQRAGCSRRASVRKP